MNITEKIKVLEERRQKLSSNEKEKALPSEVTRKMTRRQPQDWKRMTLLLL